VQSWAVITLIDGGFRAAPKIYAKAAIDLVFTFSALGHARGLSYAPSMRLIAPVGRAN
jgi:hypothetical protein